MITITSAQTRVLNFVMDAIRINGRPPTRKEICVALGFKSPNAADDHLKALSRKGFVKLTPHISRGIEVINGGCRQSKAS